MKIPLSITYLFLFLSAALVVRSQEVDILWGDEFQVGSKSVPQDFIGIAEQKIFTLKLGSEENMYLSGIEVYDEKTLKKISSLAFSQILPSEIKAARMERLIMKSDKFMLFSYTRQNELCATIFDLEGKLITGKIVLDKSEEKNKKSEGYVIAVSRDQSKILLMEELKVKTGTPLQYSFLLYDGDLNRLASYKTGLPYTSEHFNLTSLIIDERGNAYLSGRFYFDKTYRSVLMKLLLNHGEVEFDEVNLPLDRIGTSFNMFLENDRLVVVGLYSDTGYRYQEGIYKIELDKKTYKSLSTSYSPFKKDIPNLNFDYTIRNLYHNEKGEQFVVLEQMNTRFWAYEASVFKDINWNNMVVAKINAAGTIEWNTLIPKKQSATIPFQTRISFITVNIYKQHRRKEYYFGYVSLMREKELLIIYNDHTDNMGIKDAQKSLKIHDLNKKSYCATIIFDLETGKWEKKTLFNNKNDMQTVLIPGNAEQTSHSEILALSLKGPKCRIGKIRLD